MIKLPKRSGRSQDTSPSHEAHVATSIYITAPRLTRFGTTLRVIGMWLEHAKICQFGVFFPSLGGWGALDMSGSEIGSSLTGSTDPLEEPRREDCVDAMGDVIGPRSVITKAFVRRGLMSHG